MTILQQISLAYIYGSDMTVRLCSPAGPRLSTIQNFCAIPEFSLFLFLSDTNLSAFKPLTAMAPAPSFLQVSIITIVTTCAYIRSSSEDWTVLGVVLQIVLSCTSTYAVLATWHIVIYPKCFSPYRHLPSPPVRSSGERV